MLPFLVVVLASLLLITDAFISSAGLVVWYSDDFEYQYILGRGVFFTETLNFICKFHALRFRPDATFSLIVCRSGPTAVQLGTKLNAAYGLAGCYCAVEKETYFSINPHWIVIRLPSSINNIYFCSHLTFKASTQHLLCLSLWTLHWSMG